jgi:hypothetical protein
MANDDLELKLAMRRAFWATGASTRTEVKLSSLVPRGQGRSRGNVQEWTDLDVLGIEYSPMSGLAYALADCKTLKGRVTERVFWLRGVADLFGARSNYLVRSEPLPAAARQLALRLGVAAFDPSDLNLLLEQAGVARLPVAGNFLEGATLARWNQLLETAPKAVERLGRYRRAFYWVVPPHRNLVQLPAYARDAASHFDPNARWAQVLVIDLAWLYLHSLLTTLERISRLQLSDPVMSLQQTVLGGEPELRERQQLAEQLSLVLRHVNVRKGERIPTVSVLPEYFDVLVEAVARIGRRRDVATEALRCLEFVGVETVAAGGARWREAFPTGSGLAIKLASDMVRTVVRASGLSADFVTRFDEVTRAPAAEVTAAPASPGLFDSAVAEPEPKNKKAGRAEPSGVDSARE